MMERRQQIESLFQEALQRDPAERDAWLLEACRGDSGLRREVASLLANYHPATDFEPWATAAAAQLIHRSTSLKAGQRLGPYEILAPIGKGGMGEVYKARDTRLKRDVAIKICAAQFSERFEREARVIASLNHANICHLYDVGPNFLVMELVEGENLAGPLPLETALNYARQIAEALEAAHEKGIVHRDLKPANVKITLAGAVKVLDFGLAKAAEEPSAAARDPSVSPTMTMSPTVAGMILGTAPYMSPEQARGKAVDKRADIWAFGCVLYEMLTGKQAFCGETTSDILAAVISREPDLDQVPAHVRPVVEKCLRKNARVRWCDIGDVRIALDEVMPPSAAPTRFRPLPWVAAGLFAIASAALAVIHFRLQPPDAPLLRLTILPPEGTVLDSRVGGDSGPAALSGDGSRIVFSATAADGKQQLWIRPLDALTAQPLAGTEGACCPFWSPDNKWLGFFADGKLKKMDSSGGPALVLSDAPRGRGGTWSREGTIVFAPDILGPLHRVSSSGGASTRVTSLDPSRNEISHRWPLFLADGRRFLYTARIYSQGTIRVASIDSQGGDSKVIANANSNAAYAQGYLLFTHDTTLIAQRFDLKRLATTSGEAPIAEHVRFEPGSLLSMFAVSDSGLLAYQAGEVGFALRNLTWLDRGGKQISNLEEPAAALQGIALSPDGKNVAITARDRQNMDIWILNLSRGLPTRFTFDPAMDKEPVWSPDGRNIVFTSSRRGHFDLYRKSADGSGAEDLLYADNLDKHPTSWSADGKSLLYWTEDPRTNSDLWVLPEPGGQGERRPVPFLKTENNEGVGQFSPNGRWIAYTSNESGRMEILIAPFPGPGGKRQVSASGGTTATWRRDGKEIYYIDMDRRLMAVDVRENGTALEIGAAHPLFGPIIGFGPMNAVEGRTYDVSADGQRILALRAPESNAPPQPITLVQNWIAALRK